MTRPFPVVGIATKFTNAVGRRSYQTNVGIILIYEIIVFISLKKRTNRNSIFSVFVVFFFNFCNFLIDGFFALSLSHLVVDQIQNTLGYIVQDRKSVV